MENTFPPEASWKVADTVKFAHLLAEHGVDLLDVSSGGSHLKQELPAVIQGAFHAELSEPIKAALGDKLIVGVVGGITTGTLGEEVLQKGQADLVFVGRHFQKNPGAVWQFAEDLGIQITVAHQIGWGYFGRGGGRPRVATKN